MPTVETADTIDSRALYSKISWRLIPYIFILYILAYLDRVNVGFAALEMKRDLHLTDTVYGFGAGIFFLGSSLFDLPSNLLLNKVGPRLWIARIMITWGIIATCMSLVTGPHSFYILRFFLGVSEAGFFPGMILYLTFWFPSQERARAVAKFMTATSLAGVIGGPLSSFLLKLEGRSGLHGWQWLFLCEGIPTMLMGVSVLFVLKDRPDDADWLSGPEKKWLDAELERDSKEGGAAERHNLLDAFKLPIVWVLAGVFFIDQVGIYTVNLWMPLVLNSLVHPGAHADALSAGDASMIARYATIPYLAAAIFSVIIGWTSDRTGDRRWHIAGCLLLSAIGFGWAGIAHSLPTALIAFGPSPPWAGGASWAPFGRFPPAFWEGAAQPEEWPSSPWLAEWAASAAPTSPGGFATSPTASPTGLFVIGGMAVSRRWFEPRHARTSKMPLKDGANLKPSSRR